MPATGCGSGSPVPSLRKLPTLVASGLVIAVVTVGAETAFCRLMLGDRLPDIVLVFLLGVVLLALRFGYAASLPATALSVLAFDFFFTRPLYSLGVQDKRFIVTFALMAFVATVISDQTERIVRRERRTARLYAMSKELNVARFAQDMAAIACRHLSDAFDTTVWVILPGPGGGVVPFGPGTGAERPAPPILAAATDVLAAGPDSSPVSSAERIVVLRGSEGPVGVLVLHPGLPVGRARGSDQELLDAFGNQLATALERARLARDAQAAQVEVQTERLRNALLSSVSHDFWTPLGVIKGAVTAMIDQGAELSPARRAEHLQAILEETNRLSRLLRNLLSMTSLEAGAVRARMEWQPLEEVIGVALGRLEEQLTGRPVVVAIEPGAELAHFDAALLEQVIVNLVENAVKHTGPGLPIEVGARRIGEEVEVEVADRGPGVAPEQREAIFDKFRQGTPGTPGMGLGLTICRGIITSHGGRIWCDARPGGGAAFRFTLPAAVAPSMESLPETPLDT